MRGLITAIRTLTRLPIPGQDCDPFARSLPFFPLVGALLGLLLAAVALWFASYWQWTLGAGVAAALLAVWLTRGLHLDGLGDVADALGGGYTPERRLAIMKDPHLGAFGVMAIVGVLLIKTAAYERLAAYQAWRWMVLPSVLARTMLVALAVSLPYARREGGTARGFVQGARAAHLLAALGLAAVLSVVIAGATGVVLLGLSLAATLGLRAWMRRHFGGVTGDLLGMANEVLEAGVLVALAGAAPFLSGLLWPL